MADTHALAQAGAGAAVAAPPGTTRHELKELIREAVREEAEERNLKGVGKTEADMIGASVIQMLEARGAFTEQPQPEPTPPVANPAGDNQAANQGNSGNTGNDPAGTTPPEERPRKKTLAERMLRG